MAEAGISVLTSCRRCILTLKEALKVVLKDESIEDFVYNVRDRASESRSEEDKYTDRWELPRVKNFSEAVTVLEKYYAELCRSKA